MGKAAALFLLPRKGKKRLRLGISTHTREKRERGVVLLSMVCIDRGKRTVKTREGAKVRDERWEMCEKIP
jgi:hypothetical protein